MASSLKPLSSTCTLKSSQSHYNGGGAAGGRTGGVTSCTALSLASDGFGGIVGAARLVACSSSDSVVPEREAPNYDRTMKSTDLSTAVSITCARSRLNIGLSHTVRIRWAGARRCRRYTEDSRNHSAAHRNFGHYYRLCIKYTQTQVMLNGLRLETIDGDRLSVMSAAPRRCPCSVSLC